MLMILLDVFASSILLGGLLLVFLLVPELYDDWKQS